MMEQLEKNKWRFTRGMVEDAPATRGVYALWDGERVVCIGRADGRGETLRSCLLRHLRSDAAEATHYSWQICADPEAREAELLRQTGVTRAAPPGITRAAR